MGPFWSPEEWKRRLNLKGCSYDPNKRCPTCGQIMPIPDDEEKK